MYRRPFNQGNFKCRNTSDLRLSLISFSNSSSLYGCPDLFQERKKCALTCAKQCKNGTSPSNEEPTKQVYEDSSQKIEWSQLCVATGDHLPADDAVNNDSNPLDIRAFECLCLQ